MAINRRFRSAKADLEADYSVGYRKPPKAGQFTKGKSGNPNGRPRKRRSKTLSAEVDALLRGRINAREGEKSVRITRQEAIARVLVNKALQGDASTLRRILEMLADTGEIEETAAPPDKLSTEDREILKRFLPRAEEEEQEDDDK